jgi:hypothetical protein
MDAAPDRRFRVGHPFRTRRKKMCGICGEVTFDGSAAGGCIAAMTEQMHARGPDAGGAFMQDRVAFGHRRLAIIDLAAASQQPMVDPQLGLAIVFNGCIYNYRQLRGDLAAKGYRFFFFFYTEVILKVYAEWGPRCVERFYGMLAFAIWERIGPASLARPARYQAAWRPGRFRLAWFAGVACGAAGGATPARSAAQNSYMSRRQKAAATILLAAVFAGGDDRHHRARCGRREENPRVRGRPAIVRWPFDRSGLAGSDPNNVPQGGRAAARRRRSGRRAAVGRARLLADRRSARGAGPE